MKLVLFFALILSVLAPDYALAAGSLRHQLLCRLRRSSGCKNLATFRIDLKDGCATEESACRRTFCKHNCYQGHGPVEKVMLTNCQAYCDPNEIKGTTRQERLFFRHSFEDRRARRKRQVADFIANILSTQIWCESECDYDERNPTCRTDGHAQKKWAECARRCYFMSDIKQHADACLDKLAISPKPSIKKITVKPKH